MNKRLDGLRGSLTVCVLVSLFPLASAWTCSIELVGVSIAPEPLKLASAAVLCSPDLRESQQNLTAWVNKPLLNASFSGKSAHNTTFKTHFSLANLSSAAQYRCVQCILCQLTYVCVCLLLKWSFSSAAPKFSYLKQSLVPHTGVVPRLSPPGMNDSLIQFLQDNITFQSVQLINIDSWDTDSILAVHASNTTFNHVVSSGCNTQESILSLSDQDGYSNSSTTIANSTFSNSTCEAITISDCNTHIQNTSFDGLTPDPVLNGGAVWLNNSGGSALYASNCNFTNNAVGSR